MVFSSILFLFYFLPLVMIIYFISPKRFRNLILFVSSMLFYAWGEPNYIWLMVFSTIVDFTCGKMIYKNKLVGNLTKAKFWLYNSIFTNIGLLAFFKYADFLIININNIFGSSIPLLYLSLPIGISFYTFQTMSYSIDVYREEADIQNNIISFGAYVVLFPQLIAGPIVRYQTIAMELKKRVITFGMFSEGLTRFVIGLGKKVLLANNVGLIWETISKMNLNTLPLITAWFGVTAFAFQIYFDFSAYSDMAIGLGKMFGFNFLENFNYPYMSTSITDFWRKWHISLGTWFREYVYIPLGGNKDGLLKQLRNIMFVWLLTGIWHGASWNFLIWGLYFGIILILEKAFILNFLNRLPFFLRRLYTLILVFISWGIFAFDKIESGLLFIKSMFNINNVIIDNTTIYLLYTNIIIIVVSTIGSTDYPKKLWIRLSNKFDNLWVLENIYILIVLILSTAYLVDQSYNPFLYFRF